MSGDISINSYMLDDDITFNFKGSIIYCYPSKLKHSQNIYFKVKGNCYNMTPFFYTMCETVLYISNLQQSLSAMCH